MLRNELNKVEDAYTEPQNVSKRKKIINKQQATSFWVESFELEGSVWLGYQFYGFCTPSASMLSKRNWQNLYWNAKDLEYPK